MARFTLLLIASTALVTGCGGGGGGGDGATTSPPKNWLIMVYMAADNNLQVSAVYDINQMEAAPASPNVKTVVQIDTLTTTAQRLEIVSEGVFNTSVISPTLQDLGEIDSASPTAIQNFVNWALANYTADNYVLVLWDHGASWSGYATDDTSGTGPIGFGALKTMFQNIQSAFAAATGKTKLNIIGFDACLMASVEVDQILGVAADYRVASCEVEFGPVTGSGWNYQGSISALAATPSMSVASFAQRICDDYIAMKNASGTTNQTMSAVDLAQVAGLVTSIDSFASALLASPVSELWSSYAPARRSATEYGRASQEEPGKYIDLREFAQKIGSTSTTPSVISAANALVSTIDVAVFYRVQGAKVPDHGGASIYYPNCSTCDPDQPSYQSGVDLAASTQWDEWLAAYQTVLAGDTTPPGVTINSPPNGTSVSTSSPVTVNVTLTGSDIARVSAWVSTSVGPNSIAIYSDVDLGALTAGTYNVTWDATAFAITDGTNAEWVSALSLATGTTLYLAFVTYTPSGGPSQTLLAILDLNYATGVGSILGFFEQTSSGGLGGVDPAPGSTLNFQFPVLDTTTGTITYIPQVQTLVVPAGGVSALTVFEAALASGSYDFDIFAQDYSENTSLDTVTLTVP